MAYLKLLTTTIACIEEVPEDCVNEISMMVVDPIKDLIKLNSIHQLVKDIYRDDSLVTVARLERLYVAILTSQVPYDKNEWEGGTFQHFCLEVITALRILKRVNDPVGDVRRMFEIR